MLRDIDRYVTWNADKRRYEPIYWRKEVLPSWLTYDFSDVPGGLATIAAAGTSSPLVGFKQPYASVEGLDQNLGTPFEIRNLIFEDSTDGTANADFTVFLRELGEARTFMNRACHVRTIFGTAQQPAVLREPYFFLSQHNIQLQFNKISGGATTARCYLGGAQYFPWSPEFLRFRQQKEELVKLIRKWNNRRRTVNPYWLTTDDAVLLQQAGNPGDEFETTGKIGDDGAFECFTLCSISTGNYRLEISEPKTKQTIMNGQITSAAALGDARFPTIFSIPFVIPEGFRLRFRFINLDTVNPTNEIFFTMQGRKIYAPWSTMNESLKKVGAKPAAVPVPTNRRSVIVPPPYHGGRLSPLKGER